MAMMCMNMGIETSFANWITTFSNHSGLSVESSIRTGFYFYFPMIFGRVLGIFLQ